MKNLTILATLVFAICMLNASLAFDIGFYAPKDSKVNILWGLENFWEIDERVTIGVTTNYFYRSYRRGSYEAKPGTQYTPPVKTTDAKITTGFIPIYAGFKVHIPIENIPIIPFVGADFGWGLTWKKWDAIIEGTDRREDGTDFYNGFTWRINTGVSYPLGTMSELYAKVFWNDASFEQNNDALQWQEFDMSGLSMSIGIRFKY